MFVPMCVFIGTEGAVQPQTGLKLETTLTLFDGCFITKT